MKGVGSTAHFTAAVWAELGVPSADLFVTHKGRILSTLVHWGGATLGLFGKYDTANLFLKVRHLGINKMLEEPSFFSTRHSEQSEESTDHLLAFTATNQGFEQIIELAAGLSPRGYNWVQQHRGSYIEIDQTAVIAAKKRLLQAHPTLAQGKHHLVALDLVQQDVASVLQAQSELELDYTKSTLIIVEGLTGYLGEVVMHQLLTKIHKLASCFTDCTILIDFYLKLSPKQHGRVAYAMLPPQMLWRLLRAPMRMFLKDARDITNLINSGGFKLQHLYSVSELAQLVGCEPPPVSLFYLACLNTEIRV